MTLLLDADVIIAGERGAVDLARCVAFRADDQFEIAAITVAELWHGVGRAKGPHRATRQRHLNELIVGLPVAPYTEKTAYEHARLWAKLETAGAMIGYYDVIVAPTALERGGTVVTLNKRHFSQVRGLKMIQP
jgi:tRNA(fMet)-specific endonuclease VapC